MKKALLLLAAVLTTMAASAQFEIGLGGSFGIPGHTTKVGGTKVDDNAITYKSSFNIMPTVGFRLNDAMSVGAFFEYASQKEHTLATYALATTGEEHHTDDRTTTATYGGGLYFRYNVVSYGDIRIFFEFQGNFAVGSEKNGIDDNGEWIDMEKYDLMAMRFGIVPGASYQITDNISFDVYFNFATLGYSMMRSTHTETRDYTTDPVNGTYGAIAAADQVESTFSMFGFNNLNDHTNAANNYNLATAIGVKLNVNF
jgi:hypothetical protein